MIGEYPSFLSDSSANSFISSKASCTSTDFLLCKLLVVVLLLLLALNDLTKGFLFDEDADLDMDSSISSFRLAEEFFRKNLSEDIIFELGFNLWIIWLGGRWFNINSTRIVRYYRTNYEPNTLVALFFPPKVWKLSSQLFSSFDIRNKKQRKNGKINRQGNCFGMWHGK